MLYQTWLFSKSSTSTAVQIGRKAICSLVNWPAQTLHNSRNGINISLNGLIRTSQRNQTIVVLRDHNQGNTERVGENLIGEEQALATVCEIFERSPLQRELSRRSEED